jgi:hypothetical protein
VSKSESQKARIKLYRNKSFRRELADGLGIGIRIQMASCLDALLEARRLPSRNEINSRAAAMDAALIMIAIGTIQTSGKAALHLTDRLGAMKLHAVVDTSDTAEREIPVAADTDLATDLATAFEEYWAAPDGAFLEGLCHTAFITRIADTPADDAATLLRISDNRRNSYSAPTPPAAACERSRHKIRGGMSFMPSALANFAEQLRHDLDGTAAAVQSPHPSAGGSQTSSGPGANEDHVATTGMKEGTVISTSGFVQVLLEHVGGDLKAGATPLLRFELLGRAIVGGVEYHRDGGPNKERKRFAAQIIEVGRTALDTAERHPEGWVVVDALGRPCCRLGEGQSEFHRGAEIIVFDSEDESARFTARVNAQLGDDPALPALSMSTRRFAKEATAHAESYHRVISGATGDLP